MRFKKLPTHFFQSELNVQLIFNCKALFRVLMSLILWNLRNWSEFSYQNLALDLGGGILEQKLYRDELVSTIWDQRIGPSLSLAWPRLVQCSRPNRLRRAQKILGLCSGWTILKGHRPGQSPVFLGLSYHYFLGLGSSVKYCNTYPLYFFFHLGLKVSLSNKVIY